MVVYSKLYKKMSRSSSVIRYGLLLLLTMQNTATVLCLRASMINASTSRNKYVVSTLVLTMEVIKLLLILTILMTVQLKFSIRKTVQLLYNEIVCRPLDTIPLALPSLLYVVQDNLIIYSLSCLDAATYQVTYQARILTTALFARGLLKQELPVKKWLSLFLLMLGVILTQLNFNEESGDFSFRSQREGSVYVFGLIAISCATLTSGFAGVYNEKLIKNGKQSSLLIRSLQLSLFSVFFACLGVLVKDGGTVTKQGYFHGYSPFVWLIATMQASGGIIVAGTIKYADNILKTFATSNSIVLSCILSYIILDDFNLTPTFIVGTLFILLATFLYTTAIDKRSRKLELTVLSES
ncbi:UDP-N-acetylglucosamine transporter isoform X1 [Daphnia magna]|uniref:UDP-N-acetylglucosamine transporter isoform X1 n=1 Tax=Daphnia magna TaxID=35525 RepID=UPI001402A2B0|nr:UDP-N-acetylglucosamine transporter isoform X1 [Daphnia magna]XP_032788208.1 UDP-N-acetylglucosamine transporter isoform X1 [Daphnia magna]XP_032788209.1 UDP-N-acetylglucosamine transporter isoform X1 [Daphnia magna]XP_032788210.1 UDP-N-acetylglucosamine transporter isoform X1 [Daphnia magna]XP_032788211.1 UDP-N-acetylglucosamine transporter isoform X1 [Daphnia magna]XP_045031600.1 UDP-N-acetylglucosamine transporter isoform X1 [Daphnia magna]